MRLKELDGCAVPRPLYPILKQLTEDVGSTVNSVYRGDDAAALLHANGKQTQRDLYNGYVQGRPGYLPANPPDRGSHILIGDGVVGRLHQRLKWWQCGIDVNDALVDDFVRAARRRGWELYQPYPSGSEFHHVNFRKRPARWKIVFKQWRKRVRRRKARRRAR
jgi:hypothetical protein